LRLFSFGGYGLALAALALVVFGANAPPPPSQTKERLVRYPLNRLKGHCYNCIANAPEII